MGNDKFKLDDSVFEEVDTEEITIDDNEKKQPSPFDKELSMDDLFDFMPKGVVGNDEDYLNSFMEKEKRDPKPRTSKPLTKKQKLEDILDEPLNVVDETTFKNIKHEEDTIENNKKSMREEMFKKREVLFQEQTTNNETFEDIDLVKVRSLIESAMYICGNDGVSISDLKRLTNAQPNTIKKIIKDWNSELEKDQTRGLIIKNFGERYKLFSKAENREDLSRLITIKYRNPLSAKVMETLAIIAYNQPCTRAIIEDIRAKDPTATIDKLIDLGLVAEAGRADTPGRPLLYTVTHKFYDIFGIKNLSELPKININQPFDDGDISFFDTTRYND